MTDDDIRRHIALMRSIDRPTVHLPIDVVERLMATGHKIKVGGASLKDGKIKTVDKTPGPLRKNKSAKAARIEKGLRANAAKRKGAT